MIFYLLTKHHLFDIISGALGLRTKSIDMCYKHFSRCGADKFNNEMWRSWGRFRAPTVSDKARKRSGSDLPIGKLQSNADRGLVTTGSARAHALYKLCDKI